MQKILIGGSPCTRWSVCRPHDRETKSSGIGWELFQNYVTAKEKFNPDFYLYENVASMSKDIKQEISKAFQTEPININGALVSAAERDRFYWTNIQGVTHPEERGLTLKDILETDVPEKYFYNYPLINIDMSKQVCATMDYKNNEMHKRIFNPAFKVHTLTTCGGGNVQKKVMDNGRARKLTPTEYERCMTLPDGYTKSVSETHRYTGCGNGWTAEVIIHILKHMNIPLDEEIQVLSMYDGIGTGRYCFDKLGYKNIKYVSYEIDKYAMQVANSNYANIEHFGDAFQVRNDNWQYRISTQYEDISH
jgi:DNA (cytosine-5)-methyltransferase 3A